MNSCDVYRDCSSAKSGLGAKSKVTVIQGVSCLKSDHNLHCFYHCLLTYELIKILLCQTQLSLELCPLLYLTLYITGLMSLEDGIV